MKRSTDDVIKKEENELVGRLKNKFKVLRKFKAKELKEFATNGGQAIICADGDKDAYFFHLRISDRPHADKYYSGPLLYAKSFKKFSHEVAGYMKELMKEGMKHKGLDSLYLYFHAPCGIAGKYGYDITDVIRMAAESVSFFAGDPFFSREKIFPLFHLKRINRAGKLEETTYLIDFEEFKEFLKYPKITYGACVKE